MAIRKRFILAADERGTKNWPNTSKTFAIGGFVAEASTRPNLVSTWNGIKNELCGSQKVELKWRHFFPRHYRGDRNPLISKDPEELKQQALWALNNLFEKAQIFPIITIIRKDKIFTPQILASDPSDSKGLPSPFVWNKAKTRPILDVPYLLHMTLGQFALFVKVHGGNKGEIWFDKLGSSKEQERLQLSFDYTFQHLETIDPKGRVMVKKINQRIKFLDSNNEPLIQLADFVSGTMWSYSEGDDSFLRQLLEKYAYKESRPYGIYFLEK